MSRVKVSNSGQSHCCAVPLKHVEHYSLFKDLIAFNAKFFFVCSKVATGEKFSVILLVIIYGIVNLDTN